MAAPDYTVNYNDKRFTAVNNDKNQALKENEKVYNSMIGQSDKYYKDQIKAAQDWQKTQTDLQNEQTDFAIEKIEQQKEQAHKDYLKEQSGAYVDWQKQSNDYGAVAEQMASQGLTHTGFSESSQVSMYNAYQIRVSAARESYNKAVLNYDNLMKEARLQNKSILAEIAYEALQNQLKLALDGFQYKNTLVLDKAKTKREINSTYYSRYQDVLSQINTENALAEQKRQHNAEMAYKNAALAEERRQHNAEMAYKNAALAEERRQYNAKQSIAIGTVGGDSGSSESSTAVGTVGNSTTRELKKSMGLIDQNSVNALGLGPVNANGLDMLVTQGYIKEYEENGKITFGYTTYGRTHKESAKRLINENAAFSTAKKKKLGSII